MSAAPRRRNTRAAAPVVSLVQARIVRALRQRTRYRYVTPRVVAEGAGWLVLCANCSRKVDAEGGEIPIARLLPAPDGTWTLHARDHAQGAWVARETGLALQDALARLCNDSAREYWQ